MRLVLLDPKTHKILVLCERSIVASVLSESNIGPRIGDNVLTHDQKYIGLVTSWEDAMDKFPEVFL